MRRIMAMTLCFVLVISAIPFLPALAGTVEEENRHSRERDVTDHPELMEEAWFDECYKPFTFAESSEVPDDIQGRADIIPMNLTDSLTRGRAAAYIVLGHSPGLRLNANIPHMPFNDVPMNDWARNMIAWARDRGWINGVTSTQFAPARYISRQDFAVLMVRVFNPQVAPATLTFSDRASIAPWAVPYIQRAVAMGWITGFPDGTFRPNNNISRQDGITLTNRARPTHNPAITDPIVRQITWNGSNGTTPSPNTWGRASGHAIGPLPTSTRANHTFIGWYSGTYRIRPTTLLNTTGTAFVRWRPNIAVTLNYRIMVQPGLPVTTAQGHVDAVKQGFWDNFAIRLVRQSNLTTSLLNERSGCTQAAHLACNILDSRLPNGCGFASRCREEHHRSATHFLHVPVTGTVGTANFRFVTFTLCRTPVDRDHMQVQGLATISGYNALIRAVQGPAASRRTTAHEISHLFGATDTTPCNSGQSCTMRNGRYDEWCINHINEIFRGRNR